MILVSACLLGLYAKYDGSQACLCECLTAESLRGRIIPVCPEQMGGMPTPRRPAEIHGGCGLDVHAGTAGVLADDGTDLTRYFVRGARQVEIVARICGAGTAVLKERSPSCGVNKIYDGSFTRQLIAGEGVTAALLRQAGLRIFSEEDVTLEVLEQLAATTRR